MDALVCAPSDMPVEVSGDSPTQAQALALSVLGQLYLDQGDFSMAHAALTRALSRSAATPDTLATLYSYLGYAYQISKPPDLIRAIQFYSQATSLVPDLASVHQNRGVAYIRQNEPAQWSVDFASVLASSPDDVGAHRALCWAYALDRQPELALPHCDAAVSRDSTARSREARGIVYGELGRLPEAATELQAFLDWLAHQPEALRTRYGTSRSDWVQALQAGRNPIDEAVLGKLRQE